MQCNENKKEMHTQITKCVHMQPNTPTTFIFTAFIMQYYTRYTANYLVRSKNAEKK